MRYVMMAVLAAFVAAPLVGCEEHKQETTTRNPITGSTTHTESHSMHGTDD